MIFVNEILTVGSTELHLVPVHTTWVQVAIDFIGLISPVSASGNRYILTLTYYISKWDEAVPMVTKEAFGVANILSV